MLHVKIYPGTNVKKRLIQLIEYIESTVAKNCPIILNIKLCRERINMSIDRWMCPRRGNYLNQSYLIKSNLSFPEGQMWLKLQPLFFLQEEQPGVPTIQTRLTVFTRSVMSTRGQPALSLWKYLIQTEETLKQSGSCFQRYKHFEVFQCS